MRVYNSLGSKKEEFAPIEPGKVIMYVCGLTPYDDAHLGHARTYIAFDIIKRYLIYKKFKVTHIQNITDVEDKIINRAKQTKRNPIELAEEFHKKAMELFKKLNVLEADHYPKVSEHMKEIIGIIELLKKKGYAYESSDGVYFDVSKFKEYGKLSKQKLDKHIQSDRQGEDKKEPTDFALWKKGKDIINFESPFGEGRPGWHIECSAIGTKYAKRTIDIHGGGRDLMFPHHENEVAQSEAAYGKQFVKYWMHTGFITVNGEKMSKSLGNFITIKEILSKHDPNGVRIFFALTHYKSPIDYSEKEIEAAEKTVERIFGTVERLKEYSKNGNTGKERFSKHIEEFYKWMDDDFSTPEALASLFGLIKELNIALDKEGLTKEAKQYLEVEMKNIFGILGLKKVEKTLEEKREQIEGLAKEFGLKVSKDLEKMLDFIIEKREEARKKKEFSKADAIRNKLKELGIELEDDSKGAKYKII